MRLRLWLTIAVALAVVIGAFVFAARRQMGTRTLVAVLPRADGVREGATVTFRGLEIGYVERLVINDGRIIAELRIRRSDAVIRQRDTLRTRTMGLVGDKYLDIMPGDMSAPVLQQTDTLVGMTPAGT